MNRREFLESLTLPAIAMLPLPQSRPLALADRMIAIGLNATPADPEDRFRVIEIAAIEIISRQITGLTFYGYVDSDVIPDRSALLTHGLASAISYDKPRFSGITRELAEFIGHDTLVFQGAPDQLEFFKPVYSRAGSAFVPTGASAVINTFELTGGKQFSHVALAELFAPYDLKPDEDSPAFREAALVARHYLTMAA